MLACVNKDARHLLTTHSMVKIITPRCKDAKIELIHKTTADNKVKAEKCGAVSVILRILKTHIKNADVCEQGCKALVNSIYNGKIVIPQCKDEIERINLHNNR